MKVKANKKQKVTKATPPGRYVLMTNQPDEQSEDTPKEEIDEIETADLIVRLVNYYNQLR